MHKQQRGFTLVEVLASLVMLSVILIGVSQLFIFTNKAAASNNEKLIVLNLSKATMERLKMEPSAFFLPEEITDQQTTFDYETCTRLGLSGCKQRYQPTINDRVYSIVITASQSAGGRTVHEKSLGLINVMVSVEDETGRINNQVEGYVNDE
ncbi:type IV pilus modification PilV family protein [Virgibacillus dokdonensis]|uniref:type IV pilus modification PilV family protein n=1 Tax=Virgibacillus dokdonensis TaxID=302167 RepID=UPI000989AB53|nr:prepilin-type N-terminal cleavage/methylation domain-containing protein [Virgibacillus dokdonensis]